MFDLMWNKASGFVIDFARSQQTSVHSFFNLMHDIKLGVSPTLNKKKGCNVFKQNKLVILANFLPNMSLLPLDRWSFYHTTLGMVGFNCVPANMSTKYSMFLSNKTMCSVTDESLTTHDKEKTLSDEALIFDYLTNLCVCSCSTCASHI